MKKTVDIFQLFILALILKRIGAFVPSWNEITIAIMVYSIASFLYPVIEMKMQAWYYKRATNYLVKRAAKMAEKAVKK